MTQIIDGRKIKDEILNNLKKEINLLPFPPIFCDILVGEDPVSVSYVKIKGKTAESVGIKFKTVNLKEEISTEGIIEEIENLNRVPHMCGIIVQLPLPAHINTQKVLDSIDYKLDVDCLGKHNSELFYNNNNILSYPTALACMRIINELNVTLEDKNIVILGQGKLVGLPVSYLLSLKNKHITRVNSRTEDTDIIIKNADIIISAIGKGKFITGNMIKKGAIIIDAGTSEENGGVVGDIDVVSVESIASMISKTPGGVGPVTVAMLLSNIVKVAKQKK